jgi:hypothetical protein
MIIEALKRPPRPELELWEEGDLLATLNAAHATLSELIKQTEARKTCQCEIDDYLEEELRLQTKIWANRLMWAARTIQSGICLLPDELVARRAD